MNGRMSHLLLFWMKSTMICSWITSDSIKLPDWFDAEKEDVGQVVKLMEWFRDMAAVVYVQAAFVNDFFLLHGVTGTQVQSVCIVYQF